MKAVLSEIADAVVKELARGEWGQPFAAVRQTRPRWELKDLAALRVTVVPGTWESEIEDRESTLDTYAVDVAIQRKLANINDPDQIDSLLTLAQEIHDRFRGLAQLPDFPDACWARTNFSAPLVYPPHADEMNLFTCVITLVFELGR